MTASLPTSLRTNNAFSNALAMSANVPLMAAMSSARNESVMPYGLPIVHCPRALAEPGGHPSLGSLALLVFEAVMEVVCVSLPGYIIARCGMFDAEKQKFVANLNVSLFTPCLIFTKLASQLTLDTLVDLAVIPVIFVVMTLVSYLCSLWIAKLFGFEKRARNFVIAMGVFGNSNSLPISLVISLSMTISGLHWDKIPGDNDEEVAARGILYLLIFQQLGQMVRWSWGYHVLLAPPPSDDQASNEEERYRDDADSDEETDLEAQHLQVDPFLAPKFQNSYEGLQRTVSEQINFPTQITTRHHARMDTAGTSDSAFASGGQTPATTSPSTASPSIQCTRPSSPEGELIDSTPAQGNGVAQDFASSPSTAINGSPADMSNEVRPRWLQEKTPPVVSRTLVAIRNGIIRLAKVFWDFMNPPLWAMLAAIIVASIPALQRLFFTKGTFIQNSVTRAVTQSGNVAVPLILVVLGANLAGNTQPKTTASANKHDTKILIASLLSRMVLPFVFMAPLLAVATKYFGISILDDPIFLIVCFLLTGAPSALQLAQICQINGVYETVMARVLFWSYVIVILPSTLILVVTAIEVVHWAT